MVAFRTSFILLTVLVLGCSNNTTSLNDRPANVTDVAPPGRVLASVGATTFLFDSASYSYLASPNLKGSSQEPFATLLLHATTGIDTFWLWIYHVKLGPQRYRMEPFASTISAVDSPRVAEATYYNSTHLNRDASISPDDNVTITSIDTTLGGGISGTFQFSTMLLSPAGKDSVAPIRVAVTGNFTQIPRRD